MRFDELLDAVGGGPVFETALLLCGDADKVDVQRQLSRWTRAGRVVQLRRGLYALAPRYRRTRVHPFVAANHLVQPSYVSLQSALAYHGAIPEAVPVVTSITTGRLCEYSTPLGEFLFRHVRVSLFNGYLAVDVSTRWEDRRHAFVARPEKALIDLLYLENGSDSSAYLAELRLDTEDTLDLEELRRLAESSRSKKVCRAVDRLIEQRRTEAGLEEDL